MLSRRTAAMQRVANTLQQSLVDFQDKCFSELNNNRLSKSPTKTAHYDLKYNGNASEDNSESHCTAKDNTKYQCLWDNNSKSQNSMDQSAIPQNDVHAFNNGRIETLTNCTDSALPSQSGHPIIPSNQNGHQTLSANQNGHQTVSANSHQSLTGNSELSSPNKTDSSQEISYDKNSNSGVTTPGIALIMLSGFDTDDDDE